MWMIRRFKIRPLFVQAVRRGAARAAATVLQRLPLQRRLDGLISFSNYCYFGRSDKL